MLRRILQYSINATAYILGRYSCVVNLLLLKRSMPHSRDVIRRMKDFAATATFLSQRDQIWRNFATWAKFLK